MNRARKIKALLFGLVYGLNLLWGFLLWLCGQRGDILFGILLFLLYRVSLWAAPVVGTVICWLPLKTGATAAQRLLFNLAHLLLCAGLFLLCYLLTGSWY